MASNSHNTSTSLASHLSLFYYNASLRQPPTKFPKQRLAANAEIITAPKQRVVDDPTNITKDKSRGNNDIQTGKTQ